MESKFCALNSHHCGRVEQGEERAEGEAAGQQAALPHFASVLGWFAPRVQQGMAGAATIRGQVPNMPPTCCWPGEILLVLNHSGGTYSVRGS